MLTQTVNAVLLVPLLVVMVRMLRDRHLLGEFTVRLIRVVQELMRHESRQTTAAYTAVDEEEKMGGVLAFV